MTTSTDIPELDRPPTYAAVDPRPLPNENPETCFSIAVNTLPSTENGNLELHKASAIGLGIHIKRNNSVLYYIGHYNTADSPDIILYAGYDSNGPRLAQASFIQYSKDFKFYIGDQKTPSNDDWDIVRCAGGNMFSEPSYRFESRSIVNGQRRYNKYYWKKTHDSRLGASKLSPRDFKLVDEGSEEVVAVYVEHHMGSGEHTGTINFRQKLSKKAEVATLMVLLSLLEKSRRYMRQVKRAFPNTNGF